MCFSVGVMGVHDADNKAMPGGWQNNLNGHDVAHDESEWVSVRHCWNRMWPALTTCTAAQHGYQQQWSARSCLAEVAAKIMSCTLLLFPLAAKVTQTTGKAALALAATLQCHCAAQR